jgi:hypothetical protein
MKPTEFIVENSVIAQEADDMHRDHEVQMARSQMYSAAQAAIEIHRLLKDISEMEGLEGWVQSKLTLASEYLESVRDYMKYEAVSQEPEMMAFAESAADYALESLISEAGMKDYVEKNPEKFNEPTRDLYARNTARFGGDEGQPGAKGERKSTGPTVDRSGKSVTGLATGVSKPEGVPKVSKTPITKFGMAGPSGEMDPRLGADLDPKSMMKRSMKEEGETGEERAARLGRENERFDSARNYQGRNARGDVIRSGGEVVKGNPNPPSLIQRAAGTLGLPNTATDALGDPMYKSSRPRSGGGGGGGVGGIIEPGKKRSLYFDENKRSVKESATGGASSAGGVATSVGGPAHKPTSGVPKKLGNAHKTKRVAVGKGVYDK